MNPNPELGMFGSIQRAAGWESWRAGLSHWAIVLGDQPHLRASTLTALLKFAAPRSEEVVQPASSGRPRHPVILAKHVFGRLAASRADSLKSFLGETNASRATLDIDDPGLDFDIDYPADYDRAVKLYAPATAPTKPTE